MNLTLREQADLLTLSRRSLYYQPTPPLAEEVAIKHTIDAICQPASGATQAAIRAGEPKPYAAMSRDGVAMTASADRKSVV